VGRPRRGSRALSLIEPGRQAGPHGTIPSMRERLRLELRGHVQGVGFRPFVHRLAGALGLDGFVSNDARGVAIEVEGAPEVLQRFQERLAAEKPASATLLGIETSRIPVTGHPGFRIRSSAVGGVREAPLLPDLATCPDCLAEIRGPADRRHRYPFTNCTACGPRFSIIRSLPYDRPRTTMAGFRMCDACLHEYENSGDRRFHAQPNACPACGPRLTLWNADGTNAAEGDEALEAAAAALGRGEVVAVKGLGGFHLMLDARDAAAVKRLRRRKAREEKPFALMVPDLAWAERLCELDDTARNALTSPHSPILLLRPRPGAGVAAGVAPGVRSLGIMLPYTPLHHLLLERSGAPLVATSANRRDEPICIDEKEALVRLEGIADRFLVHDRPIARHVDDGVAWIVRGEVRWLRRARGEAPGCVPVQPALPTVLALGAHLKCTVALGMGQQVFVSQHIGDLETPRAVEAFERVIDDFLCMYDVTPRLLAHDFHPDYASTRWAKDSALAAPRVAVQHHHAHLAACLAENRFEGRALGVIWDGTGYGPDGSVWGGEFLLGDAAGFRRVASLRPFHLPGGEAAVREPRRVALALLHDLGGKAALERDDLAALRSFSNGERRVLAKMLAGGIRSPVTTSAGRLFDGVAALVGPWHRVSYEGQAAMALEALADPSVRDAYPLAPTEAAGGDVPLRLDWGPVVEAVLEDLRRGVAAETISARFHNGLVEGIVRVAHLVGEPVVALSGGCFQNRWLLERTADRLEATGHRVLLHRRVPPNDGGISLGQALVAAAQARRDPSLLEPTRDPK